jgi:hypothetical protein
MGQQGRLLVHSRYDILQLYRQHEELYDRVTGKMQ